MATGFATGSERMAFTNLHPKRAPPPIPARHHAATVRHRKGDVADNNAWPTDFKCDFPARECASAEPTSAMTEQPFSEVLLINLSEEVHIQPNKKIHHLPVKARTAWTRAWLYGMNPGQIRCFACEFRHSPRP